MPDKRISQLPEGVLTPNSIFPVIANGVTSRILFSDIIDQIITSDKFITGATYNNGTTIFYMNNGDTFSTSGYFTGFTYTPEDIANKQDSMIYDGTGIKYPTVDAVNSLVNDIARTTINTGFIDPNDSFIMTRFDDFTLAISASSKGIIFKSLLETPPYVPSSTILNIPEVIIPLSDINFSGDGVYIKFIGYDDTSNIIYSDATFKGSQSTSQLGVLILKVVSGTTSFLDSTRGIINIPSIASYSNLELTMLGLDSDIVIRPNSGLTINNSNGSLKGISVNWHGANNEIRPIESSTATSFTHLSEANALTPTPPPFTGIVSTDQYWDGSSLVNLSTSGAASIQRWLVTINGNIALQYGETEYPDLDTAKANLSIANFTNVLPVDTFVEIARMAAIRDTIDLSDVLQCVFITTAGGGSGSETNTTVWGTINGNINDQTDLKIILDDIYTGLTSLNTIQITGQTLFVSGWTLNTPYYEYNYSNININNYNIVDIIPNNESVLIISNANILPQTISSNGSVKLFSNNLPTSAITVTINISK